MESSLSSTLVIELGKLVANITEARCQIAASQITIAKLFESSSNYHIDEEVAKVLMRIQDRFEVIDRCLR